MQKFAFVIMAWSLAALSEPCKSFFPVLSFQQVVQPAIGETKFDFLFLPGFGDRADNHPDLFREINRAGGRVISFSYPAHGETASWFGLNTLSLNLFPMSRLVEVAYAVEASTREDVNRPLVVSGWSTGGLLAVRMAAAREGRERKISGLFLIAPGIAVKTLPGEFGLITERTLTNHPLPLFPPNEGPVSPFVAPLFALSLKWNTILAQWQMLPKDIPAMALFAEDDVYVDSPTGMAWARSQVAAGRPMWATIYKAGVFGKVNGKHALDWEPNGIAQDVRRLAAAFCSSLDNLEATFDAPHVWDTVTP